MVALKKILSSEDGATAIEYALLAGLIGAFCIGSLAFLGDELSDLFAGSGGSVSDVWDDAEKGKNSHTRD
jgi:Flp pilus assembly pilin Flp